MTITPFLRTQAFDPELIQTMSEALTAACVTLGLTERSDLFTELVARRIIELAQRGIHSEAALYSGVMEVYKANAH